MKHATKIFVENTFFFDWQVFAFAVMKYEIVIFFTYSVLNIHFFIRIEESLWKKLEF